MLTQAVDVSSVILLVCHVADEITGLAHCVLLDAAIVRFSLQLSQPLADISDCLLEPAFLNQLVS